MLKQINQTLVFALFTLIVSLMGQSAFALERVTYFHNDALGSAVAATNQNGDLLWEESYEPFGKRLVQEDDGDNTAWFTGKQEEKDLGLQYFGARWYDSNTGRFNGIDPVHVFDVVTDNQQLFNRYAYANNNPYSYVDPDGRLPILPIVIFIGKEIAAEALSEATGGLSDYVSVRRGATKVGQKAADLVGGGGTKAVNGNSKLSQKAQHVYEIRNNKTGEVVKTGISGGKISKKGKSYRAERQRRKWGKDDFDTTIIAEIPAGPGARQKALDIEASNARGLRPSNLTNPDYHVRP